MLEVLLSSATLGISLILALLIVFAASRVSRNKYVAASTLVLERFSIHPEAVGGTFIRITGRYRGIVSWLLTNLQIGNRFELTVTERDLTLRSSSLSGMSLQYVPLKGIRFTACGYQRSLFALFFTIFFALNAVWDIAETLPTLAKALLDHSEAGREAAAISISVLLYSAFFDLLIGGVALLVFYLSKRVVIAVDSGGSLHGLAFKRSAIENAVVDLAAAEHATALLNRLVEAAVNQIPVGQIPLPMPPATPPAGRRILLGMIVAASSVGILFLAFALSWYGKGVLVRVTTTPVGAAVFEDDRYAGRTAKDESTILLPHTTREEHTFTFDLDGYEQIKMDGRVGGLLSTQDISAQLVPRKYPVTFHTNPAGSRILLDGKDVGTSDETGTLTLSEVEHGPHQMTVSHDGFRTETRSAQIYLARQHFSFDLVNEADAARQETESREREIAAHLDRGRALFRQGQYQQALDECESALKLDPANSSAIALKNQIEQTRKILGQ